MQRSIVALLAGALLTAGCAADPLGEQLPTTSTDIYLVDLSLDGEILTAGDPRNITDRPGYDNQPAFLPDGTGILYSSRIGDDVDIVRYDLATGDTRRITSTAENEYSPTPLPDGSGFSAVRVELDGVQRLWSFDENGNNPTPVLEHQEGVGYHAWADSDTLALALLGTSLGLSVARRSSGEVRPIQDSIGRSLQRIPGETAVSFVYKKSDADWRLGRLDLETRHTKALVYTRPGSEDHAWTPSGTLLMAQGSRLFQWRPGPGESWDHWREVRDFQAEGLLAITRLAVSPDGKSLALVADRSAE